VQERQSAFDHPRSDDVKGRDRHDGDDEGGIGDRGDFGDQGIDQARIAEGRGTGGLPHRDRWIRPGCHASRQRQQGRPASGQLTGVLGGLAGGRGSTGEVKPALRCIPKTSWWGSPRERAAGSQLGSHAAR